MSGTAVCVFGASRSSIDDRYKAAARRVGELIALSGHALVCGGGRGGLMAAAIDGALSAGGETIGVLPEFMIERGWQHEGLTRVISAPSMQVRKEVMTQMSMAVVSLPGGVGTLDELMEVITLRQLRLFAGEVVILNTLGYYDPLLSMFDRIIDQGFMRDRADCMWRVARTPEEAVVW